MKKRKNTFGLCVSGLIALAVLFVATAADAQIPKEFLESISGYTQIDGNTGSVSPSAADSELDLLGVPPITFDCVEGTPDACSASLNIGALTNEPSPAGTDVVLCEIAGVGNRKCPIAALTSPLVRLIELPAAGASGATASIGWDLPTSGAATVTPHGTTTTQGTITFADETGNDESEIAATVRFWLPPGTINSIDIDLDWFANAASANAVRWQVKIGCVGVGQSVNAGPTYNAASASNTAYTGGANQLQRTSFTGVAITNCAASEKAYLHLARVDNAGDTLTAAAEFLGALVKVNQ